MAETTLPKSFEPYLRYAIASDFKYFGSFAARGFKLFLLVEFKSAEHAADFETAMKAFDDNHEEKANIEFGPTDPASRYATIRGSKAAVGPLTFSIWIEHVCRVELSLPVKPNFRRAVDDRRVQLHDRSASRHPPTKLLIGVIDDGCPFAAAHFVKFISNAPAGTRVRGIWDQNSDREPIQVDNASVFGEHLIDFNYGLEFRRDSRPAEGGQRTIGLNEWIRRHSSNAGPVDEDGCYADAQFKTLMRQRSHGAHVMDAIAGRIPISSRISRGGNPPSWQPGNDPAASADVVFVQFSEACIRDATGVWLKSYVVDGIYYILSFIEPGVTESVLINVSYGPTTGPHDGTEELESALSDLVNTYNGSSPDKPKLEIFLPAGNSYLSDGHVAFERTAMRPDHVGWTWRIPPDNSVLCFAEIWMQGYDPGNVVVTLKSPSGLTSTSTTGPIPPPPSTSLSSYTGAYAPRSWGDNTVWLVAVEPTLAGSGFVPEHGDWTIRVDGIAAGAKLHAYVARSDPNMDVHSGARLSSFVDPAWQRTRSAEAGCKYENGKFDRTGSLVERNGTLNGIATADHDSVHVAGGFMLSNWRKSPYASAGPARGGTRTGPDFALPCDESYALAGIRAGGNRSGSVFRLVGTSVAAPQLARTIAYNSSPTPENTSQPEEETGDGDLGAP
jgi:hypothetical protein